MSRLVHGFVFAAVLGGLALSPSRDVQAAGRVIVIGVDGASWNLLDPPLSRGELPAIASLIERGVSAELETVEPVISPTVWSSLATGRRPENHGIRGFGATARSLRVPTVFERLAAQGTRVGLYDYLVTWPPRDLPGGFVIPGWLRRDASVTPPDVWQRIELSPFVTGYDGLRTNADYLELARTEVEQKAARFNALSRAFELGVGAVSFYAVDMTAHRTWHAAHPEDFEGRGLPSTDEERRALPEALAGIDRAIGEITAELTSEDIVIVASDHGFQAMDEPEVRWVTQLAPLLERASLDPGRDRFQVVSTFGVVAVEIARGDFGAQEAVYDRLYALLESVTTPDGRPLYSVYRLDIAERPETTERSLVERLRQWALGTYLDWRFGVDPNPDAHGLIFATPEADALDALAEGAPVQILGKATTRGAFVHPQRFTGTHAPIGVLIAAGGPIAASAERVRVSVLDVAPLIFNVAGRALPSDLEGELPRALLRTEWLDASPPRTIPAEFLPTLPLRPGGPTSEDRVPPEVRERLRSLGYVD